MVVANKQEIGPCKVELSVEVEPEQVETAMRQAYRDIGEYVNVPGFRKGKAPLDLLRRYVPEEKARAYARENLIENATTVALKESDIKDIYDIPSVSDETFSDDGKFTFKAIVSLTPQVELGEYKGIEMTREILQITEELIDERITELQKAHAELVAVEPRPIIEDDIAFLEIQQNGVDDEPRRTHLRVGENIPEFDEVLKGMVPGEEQDVEVFYPADHSNKSLAGTMAKVHVKLIEVQEEKLADIDDDFAKKIGDYNNPEELRRGIRESMEKSAAEMADRQVERRLIEEIVNRSNVAFPNVIKEREVVERLQEFLADLKKHNVSLEEYLDETDRQMEQITAGFEKAAERDIRIGLVLGEIAERENIKVEDENIETELARMADERGLPKESMRAYLEKTEELSLLRNRLMERNILDFLVHVSNIKDVKPKGDNLK